MTVRIEIRNETMTDTNLTGNSFIKPKVFFTRTQGMVFVYYTYIFILINHCKLQSEGTYFFLI